MISSRKLFDLHPKVCRMAELFERDCEKELGIDIIFTSTYRDIESQNALYAIGRTVKGEGVTAKRPMGRVVTNAAGGDSFHQYKVAFDWVALRYGKPIWGTSGDGIDDNPNDDLTDDLELWQRMGAIAERHGLEWAGRWKGSLKELCHCQYTGGLTIKDFKNGRILA